MKKGRAKRPRKEECLARAAGLCSRSAHARMCGQPRGRDGCYGLVLVLVLVLVPVPVR